MTSNGVEAHGLQRPIKLDDVLWATVAASGVPMSDLLGPGKNRRTVLARSAYCVVARLLTEHSFPDMAHAMARVSHSTLVSAHGRGLAILRGERGWDTAVAFEGMVSVVAYRLIGQTESPAAWRAAWDERFAALKAEVSNVQVD